MLLSVDTREWWGYCSDGTTSALTNQIATPLCWATLRGDEEELETLLGWDNANYGGSKKPPLLQRAAKSGHESVVEMLLGRGDVDPNQQDRDGKTPLWWAALRGHEGVVKILLGRDDVNFDRPDKYDRTPFWHAAENGNGQTADIYRLSSDKI